MKNVKIAAVAALLGSTAMTAHGAGLERSGQPVGVLFQEGNYAELSFGTLRPQVEGEDLFGNEISDSLDSFNSFGFAYKHQFNPAWSMALIYDQPFGGNTEYGGTNAFISAVDGSPTYVDAQAQSLTAIVRYKTPDNFSIYGGLVAEEIEGNVDLRGPLYGSVGLDGYEVDFDGDWGYGFILGTSWEKPEIAARVALTYRSEIDHDSDTTETFYGLDLLTVNPALAALGIDGNSETELNTPQSLTLDFQTGIAAQTLLFGSIRWVEWSEYKIAPQLLALNDAALLSYDDDQWTYTLGVGRQFTEQFAGSVSVTHETSTDEYVSTLGPVDGFTSINFGGRYTMNNIDYSLGVRYIMFGDAESSIQQNKVGEFEDNHAWAVGGKIGMRF
ncbi:OmpP1/FadL family transporter [Paracoccaceae bacterium GXU_MW_L88]